MQIEISEDKRKLLVSILTPVMVRRLDIANDKTSEKEPWFEEWLHENMLLAGFLVQLNQMKGRLFEPE